MPAELPDEAIKRWLYPMIEEAERRGIGDKVGVMIQKAAFSTAEPDGRAVAKITPPDPNAEPVAESMDYLRLGDLLRHELGWEGTYPARPGAG